MERLANSNKMIPSLISENERWWLDVFFKLKEYEDADEQLQSVFGECDGLLLKAIEHLVEHKDEIGNPYKARLLTDEDVDKWMEYKQLEEQGLLIRVPYPLGTRKLYWACDYDFEIYTLDALKFTPCRSDVGEISYLIDDYEFCEDDFGKILFLTKEEAEQALKGGNNG